VRNIKLAEKFQLNVPGIVKMCKEWLKTISRGKRYRSPVVALENPEESRMSGKVLIDLPTDPYTPIKKGI
jgi:hypothetical protein